MGVHPVSCNIRVPLPPILYATLTYNKGYLHIITIRLIDKTPQKGIRLRRIQKYHFMLILNVDILNFIACLQGEGFSEPSFIAVWSKFYGP